MPNKNKTKKTNKKQTTNNSNNRPHVNPSKIPKTLVSRVCGLVDPFCEHAFGTKYPDDSSIRTLAVTERQRFTLVSAPDGTSGFMFVPSFANNSILGANASVGGVVTLGNFTINSEALADASQFRIVSAGMIIRRISAPLTSSGMVHVRGIPIESGAPTSDFDVTAYNVTSSIDMPLQDCKELVVIAPHSSQMPQTFYNVANAPTSITDWTATGFTNTLVGVTGVPASTPVLDVEVVVHIELVFTNESYLNRMATAAPPSDSTLTTLANYATSTMKPYFESGLQSFASAVKRKAIQAIADRFMPGAGSMLALTVD